MKTCQNPLLHPKQQEELDFFLSLADTAYKGWQLLSSSLCNVVWWAPHCTRFVAYYPYPIRQGKKRSSRRNGRKEGAMYSLSASCGPDQWAIQKIAWNAVGWQGSHSTSPFGQSLTDYALHQGLYFTAKIAQNVTQRTNWIIVSICYTNMYGIPQPACSDGRGSFVSPLVFWGILLLCFRRLYVGYPRQNF